MKIGIETADKASSLLLRPARMAGETGFDLFGVFGFEVVVEQDYHREGKSFRGEKFQALFDAVVETRIRRG